MTEAEYVDVANLAKFRVAWNVVTDCIISDEESNATRRRSILQNIDLCISELEKRIDKHKEDK